MTGEPDLLGEDGELIDRLLGVANDDEKWSEFGFWLVFAAGGRRLSQLVPDTGRNRLAGSVGEEFTDGSELIGRSDYFAEIRKRLTQLVELGIREDVLVRALRDDLSARLREFTNIDEPNKRRELARQQFEQMAADPSELARLRDMIAEREPGRAAQMSDQELADEFHRMSRQLAPIPVEGELQAWAHYDRWIELANRVLSDDSLSEWLNLSSRRGLGSSE